MNFAIRTILNPFKVYRYVTGTTFCVVGASNLVTTFSNKERRKFLNDYPQPFFAALLIKSAYFGVIWPAFYIEAYRNPSNAFVLGQGFENLIDNVKSSDEFKQISNSQEFQQLSELWNTKK